MRRLLLILPGIDRDDLQGVSLWRDTLKRKGQQYTGESRGLEHCIADLLGQGSQQSDDIPAGAAVWRVLGANQPALGSIMCAEPLHWLVGLNDAFAFDHHVLNIDEQEGRQLTETLQQHILAHWPCQFAFLGNGQFVLNWQRTLDYTAQPPSAIRGRSMQTPFFYGKDAAIVQGLRSEVEMLCYQHEINTQRSTNALPTVDGFWFWGGAPLVEKPEPPIPISWLLADDDAWFIRGMADAAGIRYMPLSHGRLPSIAPDAVGCIVSQALQLERMYAHSSHFHSPLLELLQLSWNALQENRVDVIEVWPLNGWRWVNRRPKSLFSMFRRKKYLQP